MERVSARAPTPAGEPLPCTMCLARPQALPCPSSSRKKSDFKASTDQEGAVP